MTDDQLNAILATTDGYVEKYKQSLSVLDEEDVVKAFETLSPLVESVRELQWQCGYLASLLESFCEWSRIVGSCPIFPCYPAWRLGCSCGELRAKDWVEEAERLAKERNDV